MSKFSERRILVPVDFSDVSMAAVDTALDIADDPSNVHVVHILHEPQSGHPDAIWVTIDHDKRRDNVIKELKSQLSDSRYADVSLHVKFGIPGVRIAEVAEELGVELIVLPSHGRTGLNRLLIGSVAERVVRFAHCPVLVLRN